MNATGDRLRLVAAIALLLAALLATQAVVASVAPSAGRADTGRLLGSTGFAFIGGLRTFAAAVLWNRIDPIFHDYYGGVPLEKQRYMLPHMRVVTMLDPQFVQAYYVSSFMVAKAGDVDEGVAIAREGMRNNPDSGLMRANLAQLLAMQDARANLPEMLALAEAASDESIQWANDDDRYDGLMIFHTILQTAGRTAEAERLLEICEGIRAAGNLGDHDHDHDGVQDH